MADWDRWFEDTEEEKKPWPASRVGNKPGAFLAINIDSFHELLEDRKNPHNSKLKIQDPIMRAILDFDEEKK